MVKSLTTLSTVFFLAAGLAFGVASTSNIRAGHTKSGLEEGAIALVNVAAGGLSLINRRFDD